MAEDEGPLKHLDDEERACVRQYVSLLQERLGTKLRRIVLFGSAARGDMWSDWFPLHSDIDLLVLTREPLSPEEQEVLVNETYPLFLRCGRQIAPQWRTEAQFMEPDDDRGRAFKASVDVDGKILYGDG